MKRLVLVFLAVFMLAFAAVQVQAAGKETVFPGVIPLPNGFAPEGIATGRGTSFYVGSLAGGAIYRGDLRTGEGDILVSPNGGMATGMKVDKRTNYLFVSGALTGMASIYDADTGELIAAVQLTDAQATFVNDVVITRDAAYFTDSFNAVLYMLPLGPGGRLPDPLQVVPIPLGGEWVQVSGPFVFNANGIAASPNGKTLLVVNTARQEVYQVDPETGLAEKVELGEPLPNGDGLLLVGHTLYVVQNNLNQIAVVHLDPDYSSGEIVDILSDPDFQVPTTIARHGNTLYAVNARFGVTPGPDVEYSVVKVDQ